MRRCKYFYTEGWTHPSSPPEIIQIVKCSRYTLGFYPLHCEKGLSKCYTPVEIDPYWKDIIDETNRRLYKKK